MRILRWFQGAATCNGAVPGAGHFEPMDERFTMPQCLFTQAVADGLSEQETARLAGVIARLFPSRAGCERCDWSPVSRLIHFNNDPETTREDVDKVLGVFTEEGASA